MSVDIAPGHGQPGIQNARKRLIEKLMQVTHDLLGPSSVWTMHHDTQQYPFYQVSRLTNGMPYIEVRFSEAIRVYLHLWSSGPGYYEPHWHYEAQESGDFVCGSERLGKLPAVYFTDALCKTKPPKQADDLLSAWARVLAEVQVVQAT